MGQPFCAEFADLDLDAICLKADLAVPPTLHLFSPLCVVKAEFQAIGHTLSRF